MKDVYVNDSGLRVQIHRLHEGKVLCYPQGGGFSMSIPFEDWVNHGFKYEDPTPRYKLATVMFDEGPVLDGYVSQHRWNGWAMPLFTLPTALQLAKWMPEVLRYDAVADAFVYRDSEGSDEDEVYEAETIEFPEGVKVKVYPIGAGSWTWYITEEPKEAE